VATRTVTSTAATALVPPGDVQTTWLIARRAAAESLRDRMTVGMSVVWALVLPLVLVLLVVGPARVDARGTALGAMIAIYLLIVGLMPASGAIGIAAGLFAGENEHGNLLPLLATPASNRAIFAGKVLGAVLPALLYAALADATYLVAVGFLLGGATLRLVPLALAAGMLALVPAEAVLGASIASLVSSRVRTYQSAQLLTSLVLFPIMAALFGLASLLPREGLGLLLAVVGGLVVLDGLLLAFGAATWRREEVLARR
jgi:ABC-type Na+ efflux pump permease subunit